MSKWIRNLSDITKDDVDIAGSKAAYLGDMIQAGIPVPDGFVVLTTAYEEFAPNDEPSPELLAEILQAFDALGAEYVAVRSSATAEDGNEAAWAGQLESYLYVTRDTLIESVKKAWASISSPRVMAYRRIKWPHSLTVSVGVIVQRMIVAEVAGVAFTTNPVTGNANELMIEAVFGDNEQLVGGEFTPDSYLINKHSGTPLWAEMVPQMRMRRDGKLLPVPREVQDVQKIAGQNLRELVDICRTLETHFGKPLDIEWVHDAEQFYIVQARPITTLKP